MSDRRLHVDCCGTGPDLVMLHGWALNSVVWETLRERLADSYRLHLVDLPGHGRSPWRGEADVHAWARAVLASVPERAQWLGWSLGGQVAIAAAALAPDRVESLALIASTPRFTAGDGWDSALRTELLRDFGEMMLAPEGEDEMRQVLGRFLALQVLGTQDAQLTLRRLREAFAATPVPRREALAAGLEILMLADLRGALAELAVPLRFVLGTRDTLVPRSVAAVLPSLCPGAEVTLLRGAGHAPGLSHPDELLGALGLAELADA